MLNEVQWKKVDEIALFLAEEQRRLDKDSDGIVTELKKTITYLYTNQDQSNGGAKFFTYLKTLVRHGKQVGHSGKTTDYYRCIENACSEYLKDYQDDAMIMLHILGWVARLVRYYKNASSIDEAPAKQKINQLKTNFKYKEGQIINAKIIDCTTKDVDSKKTKTTITYEFEGAKLGKTEEIYNMHKKGISIQVSDIVKLKIIKVENDIIKKYERQ